MRITGQLIDAASGAHLWADRFEGSIADVFDLQDQVTASVVGAIEPKLRLAEIQRAQRKPPGSLQAYDLLLRAMPYYNDRTKDGLADASRLLRKAIEIDPGYALGFAYLAFFQWLTVSQIMMDRADPSVAEMIQLARTALALDGEDPEVLCAVAFVIALPGGDLAGGISLIDRSISRNPNSATAFTIAGHLYAYAGETSAAIGYVERALRLNPLGQPAGYYWGLALAHFVAGDHAAVVEWTTKVLLDWPTFAPVLRYRAASLGLLGRGQEGRQVVQQLLVQIPDFTVTRARRHIEFDMNNIFKTPGVADAFYDGLRRSGVSE